MQLDIRLFASLKDRAGREQITVTVSRPVTTASMLEAVAGQYPALEPALPTALTAVNREFAFAETEIEPGDEVALFPPVSGGSEQRHPTYFALTTEEPDVQAITSRLAEPEVGAIIFFQGTVRGTTRREGLPPRTRYLEYEAYEEMARQKMAQIAREIWSKWPDVRGIAIVQRIGKLDVGDTTTFVACAAGHRDQGAFAAARYGIDRLKEIVPIWKKEVGEDESIWVEGDYHPTEADRAQTA